MDRRTVLKKKQHLHENEEEEIFDLENEIPKKCQDENRNKVMKNFKEMDGNDGLLNHNGV